MSKLLECDGRRKWSLWITWPAYRGAHEKKHTKTKQKKMHCRRCLVDMRRCSEVGNRHVLPEMCLLYKVYAHYCKAPDTSEFTTRTREPRPAIQISFFASRFPDLFCATDTHCSARRGKVADASFSSHTGLGLSVASTSNSSSSIICDTKMAL